MALHAARVSAGRHGRGRGAGCGARGARCAAARHLLLWRGRLALKRLACLVRCQMYRWIVHHVLPPFSPLYRSHHHKYPMDFDRLVFPPGIAALVIAVFYVLLHQLLPVVS